ncbi:MAG TPA: cupin domain-containing protein [bacterium]
MKIIAVQEKKRFSSLHVNKELIFDSVNARVVLFSLDAGQEIAPHASPSSVLIYVVEGRGVWLGSEEAAFSAGDLCCFTPEEPHGFRAEERSVLLAAITPSPE